MRIILLLAAAAGAAAIGTAAAAAPGRSAGHGSGAQGGWAATGGHRAGPHRAGNGWKARARSGEDRRRGRFGRPGRDFALFDGGYGLAGPGGLVEPWGDGFFAGGGGEVRMKGGRPVYGYDRSYPYEWAPASGAPPEGSEAPDRGEPPRRCTVENGVRVCRGW